MFKSKYKLIIYSGIIAFCLLILTFIYGAGGFDYNLHGIFATATLIAACVHVGIVIWVRRKRR